MAQFKIRRLMYSVTAAGSRSSCVAVFLSDEQDFPIDVLTLNDRNSTPTHYPKPEVSYLRAVLGELGDLRGNPRAIRKFIRTRLHEASLSLVLEEPIAIERPNEDAARDLAAEYLSAPRAPRADRGIR